MRLNSTHKVKPSGIQGQFTFRQGKGCRQETRGQRLLMNQRRGLLVQGRMMFTVPVLVKKGIGLKLDGLKVSQIGVLPNMELVILMKPFHAAIALGMMHRRKK
jgi:hypothetical protein